VQAAIDKATKSSLRVASERLRGHRSGHRNTGKEPNDAEALQAR